MPTMLDSKPFGSTFKNENTTLHTLKSATLEVDISDFGATVVGIRCLDKYNRMDDVISGFSDTHGYERDVHKMGSVVGRVGCSNCNSRSNKEDLSRKIWNAETEGTRSMTFRCTRNEGEDGRGGNINIYVKYKLHGSQLQIQHMATTDSDTTINMTNRLYFNLSGHVIFGDLKNHLVTLYSNAYVDSSGETRSVENTVFDLRKPTFFSNERIAVIQPTQQETITDGQCFHLSQNGDRKLAARIEHVSNGRIVTIETTHPTVTLDCSNDFNIVEGKMGVKYGRHSCVAVIPHINSKKKGESTTVNLKAGESYSHSTWYNFSHTL